MTRDMEVKTPEQIREKILAKIPEFKLMDDTYMSAFFNGRRDLIEFVLRIIMNDDKLVVTNDKTQKVLKNLQGRSLILDVDAIFDNKEVDIEVQQENKGAKPKRARFHSSMMDANALLPDQDFDKLPETYVIFITSRDYWGKGLPVYTADRRIKELDMMPFGDEQHIIYVNGENASDTPLGKLMHDFKCSQPKDMYYKNLADRANHLKNSEGGREEMCKIMDEISADRERQRAVRIAINLINRGKDTAQEIADLTGLTVEEIEQLAAQLASITA
ncbi:MAG: PD-(D/E)XK nuclease family transposase [Oscillospiraceae bacterium]|nr:PD-(D/E)XK nuclease family transposase [Oscillospiraceae bacterium]